MAATGVVTSQDCRNYFTLKVILRKTKQTKKQIDKSNFHLSVESNPGLQ